MSDRVVRADLDVDATLAQFVDQELLPGTGISQDHFWQGLSGMVRDLGPWQQELLDKRAWLQNQIDEWHKANPYPVAAAYRLFLRKIGYLVPTGDKFEIDTDKVDPEIAQIAAPQLVVPATNPRFVLNAVNARWGSLYDALYGSDVFGPVPTGAYDPKRGALVVARAKAELDKAVPLRRGRHETVESYAIANGKLVPALKQPGQLVGWRGHPDAPDAIVLSHNGLHIEIVIDRTHPIGRGDPAGVCDVVLESAVSTIVDLEDSVACVDGVDKAAAYRSWLGLMKGDLTARFEKDGQQITRAMAPDRHYAGQGGDFALRARSLLLVRNVGLLMTTPAVRDAQGQPIPEGMLDALVTVAAALHDLNGAAANSPAGSVYVVKPKLHGPEEVDHTVKVFDRVEDILTLPRNTIKLGLMDEERRTSANLAESIRAARHRVVFINTGFLDRTGDEIHASMEAGPMVPKADMAQSAWLGAYETRNVYIGIECGLAGRAQIGKGMWARPDAMADMLDQKIAHPQSGASCAWVPSPTAATLHALHYHHVNVADCQRDVPRQRKRGLDALLTPPVSPSGAIVHADLLRELDRNAQSILGYVVRWVDHGIGCSKVPDIDGVALMEDRATCRISAQILANWRHQGLLLDEEIEAAFERMAAVVDAQNADDPAYSPMTPDCDGAAYLAAVSLVLQGREQPSGYTDLILHEARRQAKQDAIAATE